jgi:type I restriction enzyme, S subunit
LSELGTILTGNTPLKNNIDSFGSEFNFYKPSDLNSGFFVVNSLDKLSSNGYKIARTAPEGSILVTCIGATIGKTGLIRKEGAFNQQINAIIPNRNFLPEFIFYQIISPEFQLQLKQKTSSTTIPIINKGKFLQLNVIQFPLDLQQQIVQELESKFTLIENLETTIENEFKKTKAFSQTILKKAFEGNLLQQNASDEQAIYLLEKIQIEKNNFLKLQKENIKKKTKSLFKFYSITSLCLPV